MRRYGSVLYKFAVILLMDALLTYPALLTVNLLMCPSVQRLNYFGMLMVSFAFGFAVRSLFSRRNRLFIVLICLLWSAALSVLLIENIADTIIMAIILFTAACRSSAAAGQREISFAFPRVYFLFGMLFYFVSYGVYGRLIEYKEYQPHILIAGLAATVSSLFMINSDVLAQASRAELRQSASMPSVRRNNRLLTVVLILLSVFVSAFRLLKDFFLDGLRAAVLFMLKIIEAIANFLYTPIDGNAPIEGENPLPELPPAEARPTSPFWDAFWNILIHIAAYIAIGIAIFMIVRYAVIAAQKLYMLITRMIKTFMDNGRYNDDRMDYRDEKESLMDWKSVGKGYADGVKDLFRRLLTGEPKWNDLKDNRQRIRYLYRRLLLKCIVSNYSFKASLTPGETIDRLSEHVNIEKGLLAALKRLYCKARYGNNIINEAEMAELGNARELIDGVKYK